MEEHKTLIKNIVLFLLIGAVPSFGWASGFFTAFSWASFFLLGGGCFCILWLKERHNAQDLKDILLTRKEGWALCKGDEIVSYSPFFPASSLQDLKSFFHVDVLQEVEGAINALVHKHVSFYLKLPVADSAAIYALKGEILKGKTIIWLKDITESAHIERANKEHLQKAEIHLARLQAILDKLPVLVWLRDKEQTITYCNLAYGSAVGTTCHTIQKEEGELIQPRAAKLLARKAINTNEPQFLESLAIAHDKERYFRLCEIPHGGDQGTLGIGIDITEFQAVRDEITALVNAHNNVLDHLSTAIAIYDATGTLYYYNQAYVNLYSFDEEFLKTSPRFDEVLEELRSRRQLPECADFPAYKKKCLQQLTEQREPHEEMVHLPDERTLRNFSAPYPMGGLLFMYEDVTHYFSLERHNKTLLNSYQITLNNLFEGVVVIGSDNRLELFNPSFLQLWGFTEEEMMIGQHLTLLVDKLKNVLEHGETWEAYKAKFIEDITDRLPKTGQLLRKDGGMLSFSYVPLPNGSHLISYIDITDTPLIPQILATSNEASLQCYGV
jgi:PAS domain-containing protein